MFWRDMGVVNLPSGRPTVRLTGGAAERLRVILPPGTDLTITDEKGFAQAFVVIEARAAGGAGGPEYIAQPFAFAQGIGPLGSLGSSLERAGAIQLALNSGLRRHGCAMAEAAELGYGLA